MPNILALKQRAVQLKNQTAANIKALESDQITVAQFDEFWSKAEKENEEIRTQIKAYNNALSYRTGPVDVKALEAWQNGSYTAPADVRCKGRAPALIFSEDEYRTAFDAVQARQGFTLGTKQYTGAVTKASKAGVSDFSYNTGDGSGISQMLPPQLYPVITSQIYEERLADHLPAIGMESPSYEFLRHTATVGSPAVTAEGQPKPEVTLTLDKLMVSAVKIAAHSAVSWETWTDFDKFVTYLQTDLPRQIVQVENHELLYGSGTSGDIQGLLTVPGILTHTASGSTSFDDLEESIAALRVGPSLATPDLLVLNPATWSAIRREKDAYGRYYVAPDPSAEEVNRVWGIPVISTTALAAGTGLLIDSQKFGTVLVRESMVIRSGTQSDDFIRNLVRWVFEERICQAIERPTALLKISGLPTSIGGS